MCKYFVKMVASFFCISNLIEVRRKSDMGLRNFVQHPDCELLQSHTYSYIHTLSAQVCAWMRVY